MPDKHPNQEVLLDNLGKIAFSLDRAYLPLLSSAYAVLPFDKSHGHSAPAEWHVDYQDNIRALQIEQWVHKKDEKIGDCMKNVLSSFADGKNTLALVLKREPDGTKMYFVVKNEGAGKNGDSKNNINLLDGVIRGNFQGTVTHTIEPKEYEELFSFEDTLDNDGQTTPLYSSVAVLTNAPSEFAKDYIGQGLDKLLEGVVPKSRKESYAVVFLAESLSFSQVQEIISGYEELASAIIPFLSYQFQMGENETEMNGETQSVADTQSISNSIFKTKSVNLGLSKGSSINVGASLSGVLNLGLGQHFSANAGFGYSWGKSKAISYGKTVTNGTSASMSIGTNQSTTYTYKSFMVSNLVERLEKAMKRLREGSSIGLWKYSAYIFAHDPTTSINVANYLRAITQGKESYVEPAVVQQWTRSTGNDNETKPFDEIRKSVSHFCHPVFYGKDMALTATSYVASDQLASAIAFPQKAVLGLPVYECVPFGREVVLHTEGKQNEAAKPKAVKLGNIYHMRTEEEGAMVNLLESSLTAHTFITGSTGAGKSNAVYTMLNGLCSYNKDATEDEKKAANHFLVIEPAKGEYKDVFGGRDDVEVYGTNPKKAKLLLLNPFSFPDDTHVLEHIDRLIEVFNACWPMFAAMPAVLKASIETAYINCGWNLQLSKCSNGAGYYPTFRDVMKSLPEVVDSKGFSNDTQGDYKGALLTRLESLTNGINGQVLCASTEISDEELFDRNVIIDLSRVSSSETKALLMGILVLKLQEHRMDEREKNKKSGESHEANKGLRHVTVLEEAHNLLRRTSSEQSQESANLQGKSVEMLTNAIAEMRTYGEGFIIADQAPGLLDMAVIRNTNTKIILRLPDESDRKLVGKAAGLNDDQIVELSRLDTGVAAVYQNHWLEPVLCKVTEFKKNDMQPYEPSEMPLQLSATNDIFFRWLITGEDTLKDLDRKHALRWIEQLDAPMMAKRILIKALETNNRPNEKEIHFAIYAITNGARLIENSRKQLNPQSYVHEQIQEMLQVQTDQAKLIQEQIYFYVLENKKPMPESLDRELRRVMMIR